MTSTPATGDASAGGSSPASRDAPRTVPQPDGRVGADGAPVDPRLVDAVLNASRVLVAVAARSLGDVAEEVTLTQYRTLVVLASRGPQGLADLAAAVDVTPPTATRMCDRLVRKGLVVRRQQRGDRRLVRLALAPAGRALVEEVTARRREELRSLMAAIPADQQGAVVDSLRRLSEAAGEVPEQDWSTGWHL